MPFSLDQDGRYRDANGRLVPDALIRRALDQVIDAQAETMRTLTLGLAAGTIALADWQLQMMQAIKAVHLVALATAHGGWPQLDQSDFGWVGQRIREQYRYAARFSVEISNGKQKLDGTAVARAALYGQAARDTHREAQRRLAAARMRAGEERSNLGVADHCKQCISQAARGWQPFGTLLAIGRRTCLSNCRCWFSFRSAA